MAVSLVKGGNISLSKESPGLSQIHVGLGWDVRLTDGSAFDLDVSAFLLKEDGKVRSDTDFIFYNQPQDATGSVKLSPDNKTGDGDGDDEFLTVDLAALPADIVKIVVCVTIHEADSRMQNFGMVSKAFVRVEDKNTNTEITRYDLSEDASVSTAMIFAEIYRHNSEWKFKAIGQGFEGGLAAMAKTFGINI